MPKSIVPAALTAHVSLHSHSAFLQPTLFPYSPMPVSYPDPYPEGRPVSPPWFTHIDAPGRLIRCCFAACVIVTSI